MIVRSRANGTAKAPDETAGARSLQESRTQTNPSASPDQRALANIRCARL